MSGPQGLTATAATNVRAQILELFKTLGIDVHPTKGTQRLPLSVLIVDT